MSISSMGNGPLNNNFYSRSTATGSSEPFINVFANRDPTQYDINFPITKRWINTTLIKEWYLQNYFNANGVLYANWVLLSTGGSQPLFRIGVDANTPPGTDPVLPDVNGQIDITGGQVASGTTANVIRTDSLAANQFTIEIQRSTTAAVSTIDLNGVCHFDENDFTVNSDGFVQANGTGLVIWETISASQLLEVNHGYICISPGGSLILTMPAAPVIGDIIEVTLDGSAEFEVTPNTGQTIRYGDLVSTMGGAGNISSTGQGNTVRIVAQSATKWNVISALGALIVT